MKERKPKPVKSTDPAKKKVVAYLKTLSKARKVTEVKESETHYLGNCYDWDTQLATYKFLGSFTVEKSKIK